MNSRPARSPAGWPFWLLLAAWVCANTPPIAMCALLVWLGEARHFSHQQRLTAEVAELLTGQRSPGVLAAAQQAAAPAPLPPLPAEQAQKKCDLAIERATGVRRPVVDENDFVMRVLAWPEARREPPPHEPPRWVG